MVMLYFSDIMLTSIENLTPQINNNSNTNTIKNGSNGELDGGSNDGGVMVNGNKLAKAILICHPNSHSFSDRWLVLDKPIKIGRSVGHNKTSDNNGIFDCKVLSRNHALLWYEDGKFLLRDTRSSNGTFVNTERLSKSGEESPAREVFSSDTVQFGVDVVENSRNVTHGCIIATLKLFLPNGREAKPTSTVCTTSDRNKITLEALYHLNHYLQESLHREQMLESKLKALQTLMQTLRESTELSWKALISNNNLLSRVELLEVQLKCYSKKFSEDELREELRVLREDKNAYEGVVKQYFQKILDEKIEATQQCQDLNRALANTKSEYANAQELLVHYQNEVKELAVKNALQEKTIEELEERLQTSEETSKESAKKLVEENATLFNQIKNLKATEEVLQQTIKELETHGDYAHRQAMSLQSQIEEFQKHHSDILCELVGPAILRDKINDVDLVKSLMTIYTEALRKCRITTMGVQDKVDQLRNSRETKQADITSLEYELSKCMAQLQNFREEQAELEAKIAEFSERKMQLEFKPFPDILDELNDKKYDENDAVDLQEKKKFLNVIQRDVKSTEDRIKSIETSLKTARDELTELNVARALEEDKLDLCEKQLNNLQTMMKMLNERFESLDAYQKEGLCIEDVQSLKKQLLNAHEMTQEKQDTIVKLTACFNRFANVVEMKLEEIEVRIAEPKCQIDDNDIITDLESLKMQAKMLTDSVNELQRFYDNCEERICTVDDVDCITRSKRSMKRHEVDEFVVLKEKYRCAIADHLQMEKEFRKLRQQYDTLKSYPYFDLYFVLPAILLFFFGIFNYSDKLSHIFDLWD